MTEPLLDVRGVRVEIMTRRGPIYPLNDVSFSMNPGEAMGLVGESGSGKSMTLRTILGLLPRRSRVVEGQVLFKGTDLLRLSRRELRRIQGRSIAMVFQEPMTALNPLMRIGTQIAEPARLHLGLSRSQARDRALELLRTVGIPDPDQRLRAFPHELSGGMRQRVMIAMALSCRPELILCDEPTTALDVTIQDQILKLLVALCRDLGVGLIFVTHDLPVVAMTCQHIAVMYAGKILETGSVDQVLTTPRHPYTFGLLRSLPTLDTVTTELKPIRGMPPDIAEVPPGCPFHPRCELAHADCNEGLFPLVHVGDGHTSACRYHEECAEWVESTAATR